MRPREGPWHTGRLTEDVNPNHINPRDSSYSGDHLQRRNQYPRVMLCPVSPTATSPSGKVVLGSRISRADEAWLVVRSRAVVCSGQGYLAQQFKAAVPIPGEPWGWVLRERRWRQRR